MPRTTRTRGACRDRGEQRRHVQERAGGSAATDQAAREGPEVSRAPTIGRTDRRFREPDGAGILVRPGRDMGAGRQGLRAGGAQGPGADRRALPRAWYPETVRARRRVALARPGATTTQ